jgi:hypothetical protein
MHRTVKTLAAFIALNVAASAVALGPAAAHGMGRINQIHTLKLNLYQQPQQPVTLLPPRMRNSPPPPPVYFVPFVSVAGANK